MARTNLPFMRSFCVIFTVAIMSLSLGNMGLHFDFEQSGQSPYKPSPLGYGSPPARSSPFRRPESPASPSPLRYTTPTGSPTKAANTNAASPSKFGRSLASQNSQDKWTPKEDLTPVRSDGITTSSPVERAKGLANGTALSLLQPSQVRLLRDAFQILDRDCDGVVNRDDVADMLGQLGLPASASDVSPFFPSSSTQSMPLAAFLNSLAEILSAMSSSAELSSAFSAFDNDDSGQIDLAELKDALLNTAPEPGQKALSASEVDRVIGGFTGRRAFNRNMNAQLGAKKGEVFRYPEFVNSIMGAGSGSEPTSQVTSEAV